MGGRSLIPRPEAWMGLEGRVVLKGGRTRVLARPGRLPKASASPAHRFEKTFLESEAVSEPHLGANINACEELRWVSRSSSARSAGGARALETGAPKAHAKETNLQKGEFPGGRLGPAEPSSGKRCRAPGPSRG